MINSIQSNVNFKGVNFTCIDPRTNLKKFITQVANGDLKKPIKQLERKGIEFDFVKHAEDKGADLYMYCDKGDTVEFFYAKPSVKVKTLEDAKTLLTSCIERATRFLEGK